MKLNEIKDNSGSTKSRKRIGRGMVQVTAKHLAKVTKAKNQDLVSL